MIRLVKERPPNFEKGKGTLMARLAVWVLVGTICAGMLTIAAAQQGTGSAKSSSQLPAEVCQAMEQYVASIDAARSKKEKTVRREKYGKALQALTAVLKPLGESALLAQAEAYVQYSEQVVVGDPSNPKFDEMVDTRLKTRSALLQRCEGYTSTR